MQTLTSENLKVLNSKELREILNLDDYEIAIKVGNFSNFAKLFSESLNEAIQNLETLINEDNEAFKQEPKEDLKAVKDKFLIKLNMTYDYLEFASGICHNVICCFEIHERDKSDICENRDDLDEFIRNIEDIIFYCKYEKTSRTNLKHEIIFLINKIKHFKANVIEF